MTTISAQVATWTRRELQCLVVELSVAAGVVHPRHLAAARLCAAEAEVAEIERAMSAALDDYVRATTLEHAVLATGAVLSVELRRESAASAERWRRLKKRASAAWAEVGRRRTEWEATL